MMNVVVQGASCVHRIAVSFHCQFRNVSQNTGTVQMRVQIVFAVACAGCKYSFSALLGTDLRSCLKVKVAIMGSPFLIACTVSVVVNQH